MGGVEEETAVGMGSCGSVYGWVGGWVKTYLEERFASHGHIQGLLCGGALASTGPLCEKGGPTHFHTELPAAA